VSEGQEVESALKKRRKGRGEGEERRREGGERREGNEEKNGLLLQGE
jgi:hypothetical protein